MRLALPLLLLLSLAGCQKVASGIQARHDADAILAGMQQSRATHGAAASVPAAPGLSRADQG